MINNPFFKQKYLQILDFFKSSSYSQIIAEFNFIALILLAFVIPFNKLLITSAIALWVLTWLLEGNFVQRFKQSILSKRQWVIFLLFVGLYLIHVVGVFYSENKDIAYFDLEVKLSILVFPLVLFTIKGNYKKKLPLVFKSFVLGLAVSSFVCLFYALFQSLSYDGTQFIFDASLPDKPNKALIELVSSRQSKLSYGELSLWHHPSYFSMFLSVGMFICYTFYKRAKDNFTKILNIGYCILFGAMIYLLASRAGLIVLMFELLFIILLELKTDSLIKKLVLIVSVLLFGWFVFVNSQLQRTAVIVINKVSETFNPKKQEQLVADTSKQKTDARLLLWKYGFILAKENPLVGLGIGDAKEHLVETYKKYDYKEGYERRFNPHNQYLELVICGGLLMLSVLIFLFGYSYWYAIKNKKTIFFVFLSIVFINFMFEVMLNRMDGVIFITLFWLLLTLAYDTKKQLS